MDSDEGRVSDGGFDPAVMARQACALEITSGKSQQAGAEETGRFAVPRPSSIGRDGRPAWGSLGPPVGGPSACFRLSLHGAHQGRSLGQCTDSLDLCVGFQPSSHRVEVLVAPR